MSDRVHFAALLGACVGGVLPVTACYLPLRWLLSRAAPEAVAVFVAALGAGLACGTISYIVMSPYTEAAAFQAWTGYLGSAVVVGSAGLYRLAVRARNPQDLPAVNAWLAGAAVVLVLTVGLCFAFEGGGTEPAPRPPPPPGAPPTRWTEPPPAAPDAGRPRRRRARQKRPPSDGLEPYLRPGVPQKTYD